MACATFGAALKEPESDASNTQLRALITDGNYSDTEFPYVAEDYLRAFYNIASSHVRRRWVGIALARMLDESPEVAKHLQTEKWRLQGLGNIILSTDEREETKIIAGIVIRQALQHGIAFPCFWASDKVRHSAVNFPNEAGPRWMSAFQAFLDTLSDLALANPVTEPCIIFPVSVLASDSFRWASSKNGLPIAILQQESLTILLSDDYDRDIQFLEVPLAHISSTRIRASASLHDSQSRETKHEPWDLVLTLEHDHWTYRLNTFNRTASEVTILFRGSEDATELDLAIKELQESYTKTTQRSALLSRGSRSPFIDISSSPPPQSDGKRKQVDEQQVDKVATLDAEHPTHQPDRRSNPRDTGRSLQRTPSDAQELPPSPDLLSKSPSTVACSMPPAVKQVPRDANAQGDLEATQKTEHAGPSKQTKVVPTRKGDAKTQSQAHGRTTRTTKAKSATQSTNASDTAESLSSTATPVETAAPGRAPSKPITYSKGKLQKVSKATKHRASQQLRKQTDVFEVPKGKDTSGPTIGSSRSQHTSQTKRVVPEEAKKAKAAPRISASASTSQGRKTRSKRKPDDDDDDFIPYGPKTEKKAGAKRKSKPDATVTSKPPKKKAKIEPNEVTEGVFDDAEPSSTEVLHAKIALPVEVSGKARSQRSNPTAPDKSSSSATSSRTSLIGGLLGSQKAAQPSKATFKKPAIPTRTVHAPSTPTRHQSHYSLPAVGPHTPTELRNPPNANVLSISSSPPGYNLAEEEFASIQHGTAEKEVLSSNHKPVPASPHAESTAISGHADRDDVDLEKRKGDLLTAKNDPFKQRRQPNTATSFTRRLTGDDFVNKATPSKGGPTATPARIVDSVSSVTDSLVGKATSQPLPQPKKDFGIVHSISQPAAQLDVGKVVTRAEMLRVDVSSVSEQPENERSNHTSQMLKRTSGVEKHADNVPENKASSGRKRNAPPESPSGSRSVEPVHTKNSETNLEDSVVAPPPQVIDDAQVEPAADDQDNGDMCDDTTLVNDDAEEQLPTHPKSPVKFRSSPPVPGSPSSHSSTSAESEPPSPPPIPTSDAEEMEWEATLQPHQRALHDLLIRVSKRVTRHVVDNETAVTDIAEMFANDGEHLLGGLLQRHDGAFEGMWEDLEAKKTRLRREMEVSARTMAKERKRLSALA